MTAETDYLARTDGTFFSTPVFAFDREIGYRCRTGTTRLVSLAKGELIYDNRATYNNCGQHASYDYSPKKKSPDVFRIAVLGDSLTNGINMQRTWTETLQELLRARPDSGREVEVYAFPVDGGGILNWHAVFMRRILPVFEFDALIMGDTTNDYSGKFITAHSTKSGCFIGFLDRGKRTARLGSFKQVFPRMTKYYDVIPEPVMDELVRRARRRGPGPRIAPREYLPADETAALAPRPAGSDESLTAWYGETRLGMLGEIVRACRRRRAAVIYYAMPRRSELILQKKRHRLLRQQACAAALARQLGIVYFDGYDAFSGVTARDAVDLYWLKYDGHWTQPAANAFAGAMAGWIVREQIVTGAGKKHCLAGYRHEVLA